MPSPSSGAFYGPGTPHRCFGYPVLNSKLVPSSRPSRRTSFCPAAVADSRTLSGSAAWIGYLLVLGGTTVWLTVWTQGGPDAHSYLWATPGWQPSLWFKGLLAGSLLALAVVPWKPITGLFVYVTLAYGLARYNAESELVLRAGVLEAVCALTALGWLVWMFRQRVSPSLPRRWQVWLMLAFACWLGFAAVAAVLAGRPWDPPFAHSPVRFVEAVLLFLLAAQFLADRATALLFAGFVGAILTL